MTAKDTIWKKDILGWSLYDFANTIYSMNIVSQFCRAGLSSNLPSIGGFEDGPTLLDLAISHGRGL